ncbi:MAG TPA: hypothetical protein VFS95_13935 [Telluria sp.]|nr:hypothetical protein [Telluria sp.]
MRWLLFFLLALGCHGSASARGFFQAMCEDRMKPTVATVTSKLNGYTVDNTVSLHQLPAKTHKPPPAGGFVLGLTVTRYGAQVNYRTSSMRNPLSHYECTSADIVINMAYEPTVIYVGREFRPGTCAYREILAHEMRHLNTYFEQLPKVETAVRTALERRFPAKAVYGAQGQAQADLKREIEEVWGPYFDAQMKKADRAQDTIDTPQEYARLSRVCQGEVQSFIAPVASMSQ